MIEITLFILTGFVSIFLPIFFSKGWRNQVAGIFFLVTMVMFSTMYLTVVYEHPAVFIQELISRGVE